MSKVDDELTRRLRRAERPLDGDDLFEGLERRRSYRERLRKVQAGMLAFAVLAGTAGGFIALREVFGESGRGVGKSPVLAENGEIVFSLEGTGGYAHLYAMQPDGSGRRQITDFGTNDTDPTVSPDGRTIAFVHQLEDVDPALATIPIKGGTVTWLSDPGIGVREPAWSPDGSTIAFVGVAERTQRIMAFDMASGEVTPIVGDREEEEFANPAWSPDGKWLAFSARASGTSDPWELWTMTPDGTQRRQVGWASPERNAAAWSPDGTRIAVLLVHGDRGEPDEVWTTTPDPESEGLVTGGPPVALLTRSFGTSLQPNITWSPDGSTLLVSDDRWIYRVERVPRGDPRENLTRLAQGGSPAWQPLPAAKPQPSPTSEATVSPSPEPAGRDIGLGFNLCNLERLGGIDFLGDGTDGTAWTGTRVRSDGTCPPSGNDDRYGVAVDFTGDDLADSWSGETIASCVMCAPFKATDLNGDGGDDLIVTLSYFSIMQYGLFTVMPVDAQPSVVPFRVGEPGHPQHALDAGDPFTFWVGGDAGSSDYFYCDRLPEFWLTGTESPIDGGAGDVTTWHETHVSLGTDGIAHILSGQTYTVPYGTIIDHEHTTSKPDCGLGVDIQR
jgi:WD40 repeat protein